VKIFLEKYYPNVSAEIVSKDPVYVNLREPADTPSGYVIVEDPSLPPEDPDLYEEQLALRDEFQPRCLTQ